VVNNIEKKVKEFLLNKLNKSFEIKGLMLNNKMHNTNLFELGVLDSIDFLELIASLEIEFDIEINFSEIDPLVFGTLNGLAKIAASSK
jgi:acyl carrier protein|tara:strand:- start:525 stop:788 length:264 start_codon:yes stop_codon:yes gene_type:complete